MFGLFSKKNALIICSTALVLGLAACSANDEGKIEAPNRYVERPVEDLYNEALDELTDGIYRNAAAMFDEVERQHPYSSWARRAMLMSAYAHYLDKDYDLTILSAERFLALHPGNKDAPYAHYLIAVSYYEQITDVGRDQKTTELALANLLEVVRRYPDSEYARDARLKIDLTQDHLAGKEMAIGRYYLFKGEFIAATNRFTTVVQKFQTTTHVPEALHRLVEANLSIGLQGEAQSAAAVLGFNYPGSRWYEDAYDLMREADLEPYLANQDWLGGAVTREGKLKELQGLTPGIPADPEGRAKAAEDARSILFPPQDYTAPQSGAPYQDPAAQQPQSQPSPAPASEPANDEPEIIINEAPMQWDEEEAKPAPTGPVDIYGGSSPYGGQ